MVALQKNISQPDVQHQETTPEPSRDMPIRLLKIARIKSNLTGAEGIIVVRQLSRHFARFDAYLPLLVGEAVEIDFDDMGGVAGIITDKMINSFTLQFTDEFDPVARLSSDVEFTGSKTRRRPRVASGVAVTLQAKAGKFPARIIDLSVGGAKIAIDEPMPASGEIQIRSWDRTPITARIAWQANGEIGVIFVRKLSIAELLTWSS